MHAPLGEDARQIRTALITHIGTSLATYRDGPSTAELSAWVQPLSTLQIARCLGRSAGDTATRLADALAREGIPERSADEIAAAVEAEYPLRPIAERTRLAEFTRAIQKIEKENDGDVTELALAAAGFGAREAGKLMPAAKQILAALSGETVASSAAPLPPIERLRRVGEGAEPNARLSSAA